MRRVVPLGLMVLLAAVPVPSQDPPPRFEALLDLGILQVADGDFETAVFTLDSLVRRLGGVPGREGLLARAYLYLGAAYVGLDHEDAARGKFRQALRVVPALRLEPDQFPPRVSELFAREQLELQAIRSNRGRKLALIGGAVTAAGAVGVSALVSKPPGNRPPAARIAIEPPGEAIVGVTNVSFAATASDPDGDALTYDWDFGDGARASGDRASHVYAAQASFTVTLTARDPAGASGRATASLTARTLTGTFESNYHERHACTQTGATVNCPNLEARPLGWRIFRVTLADPRRVVGGVLALQGFDGNVSGSCIGGDVSSDLNQITCIWSRNQQSIPMSRR